MIKVKWLRFYQTLPERIDQWIASWDMSFGSTSDNASYVVGSVYAKKGADIYLVDQIRERMDFPSTISALKLLKTRYPKIGAIVIEKKANGAAVIDSIKKTISGVIAYDPETNKEARMNAVSYLYEAGNVHYPNPDRHHWVGSEDGHINEIVKFPHAKHNDRVDAESQALLYFTQGGVGKFTSDMAKLEPSGLGLNQQRW